MKDITPELKEAFEKILNEDGLYEATGTIGYKQAQKAMHSAYTIGQQGREKELIEVFKWLLGYYDFPEPPPEGRPRYYWRSHLRDKLKEIGIEIENPQSPFQPNEKGTLHV